MVYNDDGDDDSLCDVSYCTIKKKLYTRESVRFIYWRDAKLEANLRKQTDRQDKTT